MSWPQIFIIGLIGVDLGIALAMHGKPRQNFNIWHSLVAAGILIVVLYWGGFWS